MRCMVLRLGDERTEAGVLPDGPLLAAMGAYMEEMGRAGVLRGGDGLRPSRDGARVVVRGGEPSVEHGPFAPAGERLAGYILLEVASLDEAVEWMRRWPKEDGDVRLEIRPFYEMADFGEAFTPEMREAETQLRAETEGKPS